LASAAAITADSKPPKANISSSTAASHPSVPDTVGAVTGTARPMASHASPPTPTASSMAVLAIASRLLARAPDDTPRMFTAASPPKNATVTTRAPMVVPAHGHSVPR
jgi:hypothetical protein